MPRRGLLLLLLLIYHGNRPLAQSSDPTLSIRQLPAGQIEFSWPASATDFVLEQTDALSLAPAWRGVAPAVLFRPDEFYVSVEADAGTQFLRLRQVRSTTILSTSPFDSETGVAVTRETMVHFSAPLASDAVVNKDNFYASFGGRRILSRAELSSDRTRATLFFLEPLPGSSRVTVTLDGNAVNDASGAPLDADDDGISGGQAVISFETLSLSPLPGTAVVGRVFASELVPGTDTGTNAVNKPLAGVTITVDGMEQTLRTVTDATGNFSLNNCPSGRFFVHIDGRTVTNLPENVRYPDLAYYPFVGKAWEAVAGVTTNLAGGTGTIFLPLITEGTLQPVSLTRDTTITFPPQVLAANPALRGVSITVPANSLYSDNGARGGKVGIAPVPPDRLPGPLPPGLELPIVITVQTDGALNFDRPAPVCFPNLPDPLLGVPLPPGGKQALIVFNHDKGIWEAIGDMTVSSDGKLICSDPGMGILQPGWGGTCPKPKRPRPRPLPKPKPCYPTPTAVERCVNNCRYPWSLCLDEAWDRYWRAGLRCRELIPLGELFNEDLTKCLKRADALYNQFLRPDCNRELMECTNDCKTCVEPVGSGLHSDARRSLRPAGLEDPIRDQLDAILQQIGELTRQAVAAPPPILADLLRQIEDLREQADAVAGGNAEEYMNRRIIAAEDEIAAYAREIGLEPEDLNPGNAPPYPVLYSATVDRPKGEFILRGQTGPDGQYALFVPSDGTLREVSFYDPTTKTFGTITPYRSPRAAYDLPTFSLYPLPADATDSDRDGLPDVVEDVYGTNPGQADSDGDGIPDGAEVEQGTNPLDGVPIRTGIVGTARTPGSALEVATEGNLLAVAEGAGGVSVFNIFDGRNPILIAQVDTPGTAQALAMSAHFVAVADGPEGLAIVDVADPAAARIVHQVSLGASAQRVAAAGNFAYVGLAPRGVGRPSAVAKVDLITGTLIERVPVGEMLDDLAVAGDQVYVLTRSSLLIYGEATGQLELLGRQAMTGFPSPLHNGRRLFVGVGLAYVGDALGFSILDVSNSAAPILVGSPPDQQLIVHDLKTTGSGLLLATTSASGPQTLAMSLYDVMQPTDVTKFLTLFDTPGDARALTIGNGLAYVADSDAGIQVMNYLPYDSLGLPPVISLSTSAAGSLAEAGRPMRVTANARDDVQVRRVEFYVDGTNVFSDGNFPFEYRFPIAAPTATKTHFTLRARAIDTGGNAAWSEELTLTLIPDRTPPRVKAKAPLQGTRTLTHLEAVFSEPMAAASFNGDSFRLISAGPDGLLDTADDTPVGGGVVSYHADFQLAALDFAGSPPDGLYRAMVTSAVTDVVGNHLTGDYGWTLQVADAVFWVSETDGFWEDAENWSTGAVPGPEDHVVIEVLGDVTVTHGADTHGAASLIANERVQVTGGALGIAGAIQVAQPLTVAGGVLHGATLTANARVQLTGGIIEVPGAVELNQPMTLDGGTLKDGTVTQNGGAKLIFASNNANTLEGVSVNGDLDLTTGGARLLVRHGLTVTGSVPLDNNGGLSFVGNQTFDHTTVVFAGTSGFLAAGGNTTLTLGPALVVRGNSGRLAQGVFLGGNDKIINQGLISADVAGGTLFIGATQFENQGRIQAKDGGSLNLGAFNWANGNTGTIDASGDGALDLSGTWQNLGTITANGVPVTLGGTFKLANLGTFNRTGGTVAVVGTMDLAGGTLTLNAASGSWTLQGGTIKGGTITQQDGAKLVCDFNDFNALEGVGINGDLNLTNPGARILIRNGLTVSGNVLLNGAGISFVGDQTFDHTTVVFAGASGFLAAGGNTTLTLGPNLIVRGGSGSLAQGVFLGGNDRTINQGLISADVAGETLMVNQSVFTNEGILRATDGGTLKISAFQFSDDGTREELNGGRIIIGP